MRCVSNLLRGLAVFGVAWFVVSLSATACAEEQHIVSHDSRVAGVKLHYLTAGHGAPLILLHGYAETSRMWRPIMPLLAEKFTVIAPDLPGIRRL